MMEGLRYSLIYILCMTVLPAIAMFWFDEAKGIKDAKKFGEDFPKKKPFGDAGGAKVFTGTAIGNL